MKNNLRHAVGIGASDSTEQAASGALKSLELPYRQHSFPALRAAARLCLLAAGIAMIAFPAGAQRLAMGTIEGRVSNPRSGEYLENARVVIEGTRFETFTDSHGQYRLSNVPAGAVRLRVFFTSFNVQTEVVTIPAGGTANCDVSVVSSEVVQLEQFVVTSTMEMEASAFAINEQRYAPNLKSVASTDEFGGISEGSVGEFLKLLPGINLEYGGGNARFVSINGVPTDNVPVTIDGFDMANAGGFTGDGNNRAVELDTVALNNLARIEVVNSPTPESPASALAGSVNLVPRSAFSRTRPELNLSAYILVRGDEWDFKKTPGPWMTPTRKVHPGFDFSYVNPVNKRFGYTVSGGISEQYGNERTNRNFWRGARTPTNGGTFPNTTYDNPYLTEFEVADTWKNSRRNSFATSLDFKLTTADRINVSFQYGSFDVYLRIRSLRFNVVRVLPGNFDATSTHGATGAGNVTMNTNGRRASAFNYMPALKWYHQGPVWRAEGGLSHGRAYTRYHDVAMGVFAQTNIQRSGVTVSFDDIAERRPGVITVTDGATGAMVDPYNLASYTVTNGSPLPLQGDDKRSTAYVNVRRDVLWRLPLTLKAGLDVRKSIHDLRKPGGNTPYVFVGQDGRASTSPTAANSDDSALPFLDESVLSRPGSQGFPNIQMISPEKLYQYFEAHPTHFTRNEAAAYQNAVNISQLAQETISCAFLRADLALAGGRLKLIGGGRIEQTNIRAEGPLNDPTRNVQRGANGVPVRGPTGAVLPITTDAVSAARLTLIERGAHASKEYLRYFPSINAGFSLRENLILRGSYYYSIGRPNYNQYSGGIVLPNTDLGPLSTNPIRVNNVGIKPWTAKTAKIRLEWYGERVGVISAGAFRREFDNFFGGTVFRATPEFLAQYGLDAGTYGDYDVSTDYNLQGVVRMEGLEFDYKQVLSFVPRWARGFQVFANANTLRITGPNIGSFTDVRIIPRAGSWGISFTREKYNLRMNWTYSSRQRRGPIAAGQGIEPGSYNWFAPRLAADLKGEYHFHRRFSAFFNVLNVTTEPISISEFSGPSTPSYARAGVRIEYAPLWTFGIKGKF